MTTINIVLAVDFALVVAAAFFVARSRLITSKQKWLQFGFSIVLPFLGPLFTIVVHLSDQTKPGPISNRYYGQSIDEAPWDLKLYYMSHPNER